MAGLCAARRAAGELGASPVVLEKGTRAGGSMLLSSGVIWRYRTFEEFRAQCPGGDERAATAGLRPARRRARLARVARCAGRGARDRESADDRRPLRPPGPDGRPPTSRRRGPFRPTSGTHWRSRSCWQAAAFRATPGWSSATSGRRRRCAFARTRGAPATGCASGSSAAPRSREAWTSSTAATWPTSTSARPASSRSRRSTAATRGSSTSAGRSSSTIRRSRGRSSTSSRRLPTSPARGPGTCSTSGRWTSASATAPSASWSRRRPRASTRPSCRSSRRAGTVAAVRVAAAITHTIGGLRVDEQARVLDEHDEPIDGLFAAGADVGGISTGGYASGLAAALVLGRAAAETALS